MGKVKCSFCRKEFSIDEISYLSGIIGSFNICSECQENLDRDILEIFNERDNLIEQLKQKKKEIKTIKERIEHLKWELEHRKGHFYFNHKEKKYHHHLFYKKYGKKWY